MKKIILTGDRPTGKLHIGHYVGSLRRRVELQNTGEFDKIYIMIADAQALTDNADNPGKIRENILNVALDYLAAGLDPEKVTIFIQSGVPQLTELAFYYMNLVSVSRVQRNPTVKTEIKMRNFEANIPLGFFCYPVSQAADITLFHGTVVPAGEDQKPMIELTNELVRRFNSIYGEVFDETQILLPDNAACLRLPGTDGKAKMSKSLGNCIYLSDSAEVVEQKVKSMYTDPTHLKVSDPGHLEGNAVFTYLDGCILPRGAFRQVPAGVSEPARTERPLHPWRSGRYEVQDVTIEDHARDARTYSSASCRVGATSARGARDPAPWHRGSLPRRRTNDARRSQSDAHRLLRQRVDAVNYSTPLRILTTNNEPPCYHDGSFAFIRIINPLSRQAGCTPLRHG